MDDATAARLPTPARTTRLVHAGVRLAESCACEPASRHLRVVRGFDRGSRTLAQEVRTRLREHGVDVSDTPAPVLVTDLDHGTGDHDCAYLEVSDTGAELDRVAAVTGTPLVRLDGAEDPADGPSVARIPVMRATWTAAPGSAERTYPSALGRVPDTALDTFLVVPNQPEKGELTLRIADAGVRYLDPGTSVTMRCLSGAILVEACDLGGAAATWLAHSLEISQRAGIHRVFRDGLSTADLATGLTVRYDDDALELHRV